MDALLKHDRDIQSDKTKKIAKVVLILFETEKIVKVVLTLFETEKIPTVARILFETEKIAKVVRILFETERSQRWCGSCLKLKDRKSGADLV